MKDKKNQLFKKNYIKDQSASITVEASLSMVLFTFIMIALLTIINVCRVQAVLANAMDLTALEISQYSYLYEVLGGRSAMDGMNDAGKPANSNIHGIVMGGDEILYGVETLFTLLEAPTQAPDVIKKSEESIVNGAHSIQSEVDAIIENPKQFLLSLGALALSKGVDEIEKILVKNMCISHIANGQFSKDKKADADIRLRSLGVKDGIDGLSFQFTNLYDGKGRQDINIVVIYKARLFSPFPWLEKKFVQSASTRAWLSGDESCAYAEGPGEDSDSEGDKKPESSEEPQPSQEAEEEKKDTKYWEADNILRGNQAKEDFRNTYPNADMIPKNKNDKFVAFDEETCSLYGINTVDTFSPSYCNKDGKFTRPGETDIRNYAEARLQLAMNMTEIETENGVKQLDPNVARNVVNTIVIPENADQETIDTLKKYCEKITNDLMKKYEGSTPPVTISFQVQKGLGNSPNGPQ